MPYAIGPARATPQTPPRCHPVCRRPTPQWSGLALWCPGGAPNWTNDLDTRGQGWKGLLQRSNFRDDWVAAKKGAGISAEVHFHDLWHTGNTLASSTGASTRELMTRMGHSSTRAALIYQHMTAGRDRAIADKLGEMIRKEQQPEEPPKESPGTCTAVISSLAAPSNDQGPVLRDHSAELGLRRTVRSLAGCGHRRFRTADIRFVRAALYH